MIRPTVLTIGAAAVLASVALASSHDHASFYGWEMDAPDVRVSDSLVPSLSLKTHCFILSSFTPTHQDRWPNASPTVMPT